MDASDDESFFDGKRAIDDDGRSVLTNFAMGEIFRNTLFAGFLDATLTSYILR